MNDRRYPDPESIERHEKLSMHEKMALEVCLSRLQRGVPLMPATTATALFAAGRALGLEVVHPDGPGYAEQLDRVIRTFIPKAFPAAADPHLDDECLRDIWRAAGGEFHGPHVEHGTMPEEKLLPFLRSLLPLKDTP